MNRREMLELIVGATCLGELGPAIAAPTKKPIWHPAIGLNGFASSSRKYKKTFPIWEVLDFASRLGFEGVELVSKWPMGGYPASTETERITALKRLYDGFGLRIFSIQTGTRDAFAPEADARKRWLEEFHDRARLVRALGGSCIGMWPGGPLRGQKIEQAIDHLGQSYAQAAKIAAEMGLLAAFEIEPPFVFNTEDHMQRIIAAADEPALKVIYDPSHFDLMNGSTGRPHEMLKRIGVDRIGYLQFTDSDGTLRDGGTSKHLACGDGHVDIAASLATLIDGGFSGWTMIDAWEIPDPYDACVKGKQAFDRALAAG